MFIPLALSSYCLAVRALTIPTVARLPGPQPIPPIAQPTSPSCDDLHQCRTVWNIVWSCVVTIFSCTWASMHPNIPGLHETPSTIAFRRVKLMAMALIAPELVIAWAMRQLLVARKLARKRHGWTQAHGFFALMGGFMLFEDDCTSKTLLPDELENHLPEIYITEREIQDQSKSDVLSKGLVIVQTGWFIIQCIARGARRLPVTELELVTLAFATLNFVTYWLWWNKPLNVQCPVPVRRTPTPDWGRSTARDKAGGQGQGLASGDAVKIAPKVQVITRDSITLVLKVPGAVQDAVKRTAEDVRCHGLWDAIFVRIFGPFFHMGAGDDYDEGEEKVGTFYAGDLDGVEQESVRLATTVVGIVFGAIHCIAWSFVFPSRAERILWRISSVAVTCVPTVLAIVTRVYFPASLKWSDPIALIMGMPTGILYILSRVALLVLALTALRSLPPGAYQTVDWTTFIPHI